MSITLNGGPLGGSDTRLTADAATLALLTGKLKAKLATSEGAASKQETDKLRDLIRALEPMGGKTLPAAMLREVAEALDPFAAAEREAADAAPAQPAMSALRSKLYANTLYAPAPTFHAARALGAVLKAVGL